MNISPTTVINELKKESELRSINEPFLEASDPQAIQVDIVKIDENQAVSDDCLEVESE